MDCWFFLYRVKFWDDIEEKEKEESGIMFCASGQFTEAMQFVSDYYGNSELEEVYIKALEEGACLTMEKLKALVDEEEAKNA